MYDVLIRNGTVIDGTGSKRIISDLGINESKISEIGQIPKNEDAKVEIDATGLVVAPGFINMLSGPDSLYEDGRSMSDLYQGVTFEVFGEGFSMGPFASSILNFVKNFGEFEEVFGKGPYWDSLDEFLIKLEKKGVVCNFGSYLGTVNLRILTVGEVNKPLSQTDVSEIKEIIHKSMNEGAFGLGSALIYPPDVYYTTDELLELAKVVKEYNGSYTFHMRSEGNHIEQALDEVLTIAKTTNVKTHIHHLKLALPQNWSKSKKIITKIEDARNLGLDLTANMYTYTAGATGLTSTIPPKYQDGGFTELIKRLQDNTIREEIKKEMNEGEDWENFFKAGSRNIVLLGFQNKKLRQFEGKTIEQVASIQKKSVEDTIFDLLIEENSRIDTMYFMMSEKNLEEFVVQPWVAFSSDAPSLSANEKHLESTTHPRAYGSFAQVLSKYVREKKLLTLEQAIRKLSYVPATVLGIQKERGLLKENCYADLAIFDPTKVEAPATYENGHQLAKGMEYVLVNGEMVLAKGNVIDARPGKYVRKPKN